MSDQPTKPTIGFIGLGVMGGHMARHVSEAYDLVVFDVDSAKVKAVSSATPAGSIAEVAGKASIVLLSLPSSEIVREVTTGRGGLIENMVPGTAVIDCSTTNPTVTRAIGKALAEKQIEFLDAPVSGGEGSARDATLAIMVGGPADVVEKHRPLLDVMGGSVVRVGELGAGGVAKLVNNMIVGAEFAVIAESFALAKKNDLDLQSLYEAIRGGWAGSKVLDVAAPGMVKRDFEPGGSIDILFKDIGYALQLARTDNIPVPMTALTDEVLKTARASGRGNKAQQILIELWEKHKDDLPSFNLALHAEGYWPPTARLLKEMARYTRERDIPFFLVVEPDTLIPDFGERYPYQPIHDKLHALEGENLVVIDTLKALASRFENPKDMWVLPDDGHKNAEGNGIMARVTAEVLLAKTKAGSP